MNIEETKECINPCGMNYCDDNGCSERKRVSVNQDPTPIEPETLNSLGFQYIPQHGCEAWNKVYPGFVLFIAKAANGQILASLTIGRIEISLPVIPNIDWIKEFDKENTLVEDL